MSSGCRPVCAASRIGGRECARRGPRRPRHPRHARRSARRRGRRSTAPSRRRRRTASTDRRPARELGHGSVRRLAAAGATAARRLLPGVLGAPRLVAQSSATSGTASSSAARLVLVVPTRPEPSTGEPAAAAGSALTGVAVTTSSPKTVSSTSSGTASSRPWCRSAARTRPSRSGRPRPGSRRSPSPRPGAPQAMWTRPEHADDQRGQADDDPAVGLGLLGMADQPARRWRRAVSARAGPAGRRRR